MGFIFVICSPTVRISFGPNSTRPAEIPAAPTSRIHSGSSTLVATVPDVAALTIAARGPTAFATSLAPWAKDNSAAEQIRGIVNSLRRDRLRFSIPSDCRAISGLTTA